MGPDTAGQQIEALVKELGVVSHLRIVAEYTTTIKQRYFCDNKVIFRCDTEVALPIAPTFAHEIEDLLKTGDIGGIILSDYNKGVLTAQVCQDIIHLATKYGIFTCVDPKHDYVKYKGCSLIKPNRKEACALLKMDPATPLLDFSYWQNVQVLLNILLSLWQSKGSLCMMELE